MSVSPAHEMRRNPSDRQSGNRSAASRPPSIRTNYHYAGIVHTVSSHVSGPAYTMPWQLSTFCPSPRSSVAGDRAPTWSCRFSDRSAGFSLHAPTRVASSLGHSMHWNCSMSIWSGNSFGGALAPRLAICPCRSACGGWC